MFQVTAQAAGVKRSSLPAWTDPADIFTAGDQAENRREPDPGARAAQVAAFIRAAGGE